jgi:hypothetical protein
VGFQPSKKIGLEICPEHFYMIINFTSSVQVSGVRCQQLKSIRRMGVAHELNFLSAQVTFNLNPIRVHDSGIVFY